MAAQISEATSEGLAWCLLALLLLPWAAIGGTEQTFDVLQIGTRSYTNVTVTTKNSNYVFIVHSRGMENLRVKDLPPDVREMLGYAVAPKADTTTTTTNNAAATWTKQTLSKIETPQVQEIEKRLRQQWGNRGEPYLRTLRSIDLRSWQAQAALGVAVVLFLLFNVASLQLCRKAGVEPGLLIWLPILQAIPLFRAAKMSAWWTLTCFVPFLDLVTYIVWSVKIVKAREKSPLLSVLLLLPGLNALAFLYLAFSAEAQPPVKFEKPTVGAMAFEMRG